MRIQFILNVKIYDENELLWYKTWDEFILYLSTLSYSKTPKIRQKSVAQSTMILDIFILFKRTPNLTGKVFVDDKDTWLRMVIHRIIIIAMMEKWR